MNQSVNGTIPIGAFGYCRGGYVHFGHYADAEGNKLENEIAMSIVAEDGEPEATATVRLENPPKLGHVWLKGWSENAGLPEAMVEAGIVELTGGVSCTGYVFADEGKLTPLAIAAIEAAKE